MRENFNFIRTKDLEFKRKENSKLTTLKFQMTNFKENPRVHIFGFTFMPNYTHEMYDNMRRVLQDDISLNIFGFS